jgi:hypothetical protein
MAKRLTREQKREQVLIDLINKMFEIAGHKVTYDDIAGRTDQWYTEWTMTMAQSEEWIKWGERHLKKTLRISAKQAERNMHWANLQWGLKCSDFE